MLRPKIDHPVTKKIRKTFKKNRKIQKLGTGSKISWFCTLGLDLHSWAVVQARAETDAEYSRESRWDDQDSRR